MIKVSNILYSHCIINYNLHTGTKRRQNDTDL
nr:MAG TPA: hypothetical protein [Caudoviricetes sp.]